MYPTFAIFFFIAFASKTSSESDFQNEITENDYRMEVLDLLGLNQHPSVKIKNKFSLRNSATKFLLEYAEVNDAKQMKINKRIKRNIDSHQNVVNNVITFLSKKPKCLHIEEQHSLVSFHIHDVLPRDLILLRSELKIYQNSFRSKFSTEEERNVTILVLGKFFDPKNQSYGYEMIASIKSNTNFSGWLILDITRAFHKRLTGVYEDKLFNLYLKAEIFAGSKTVIASPLDIGINVEGTEDFRPFIIGYFNGPNLATKFQHMRLKRDINGKNKIQKEIDRQTAEFRTKIESPKICQLMNLTIDFKELLIHDWIIAPDKLDIFFCGGECNFPLGNAMNATNHAIVQALVHLKQPFLPKPRCVPTVLGSVSILEQLDEDTVNLKIHSQTIAKACGCH